MGGATTKRGGGGRSPFSFCIMLQISPDISYRASQFDWCFKQNVVLIHYCVLLLYKSSQHSILRSGKKLKTSKQRPSSKHYTNENANKGSGFKECFEFNHLMTPEMVAKEFIFRGEMIIKWIPLNDVRIAGCGT
ncbi:hypothetical protein CDAR_462521 [Caerostris darwini]|uniref:Uncharacterized protein n=1 Tax=Caerostris darwini TaxID=1538125 RepID=A0AAV4WN28_9ARAC|nr:hypothetical protein CDAR_462521 [Caerostris darwini]